MEQVDTNVHVIISIDVVTTKTISFITGSAAPLLRYLELFCMTTV